jgi:chromosome condensin MukBEF ATPase and DNA-binding subunit MukB
VHVQWNSNSEFDEQTMGDYWKLLQHHEQRMEKIAPMQCDLTRLQEQMKSREVVVRIFSNLNSDESSSRQLSWV